MSDYTHWLNTSSNSRDEAQFAGLYAELQRIARGRMAAERPGQTLDATGLVHEAWLRLQKSAPEPWRDRKQFFAAAAEAMRSILVESARRRLAVKRGEGEAAVPLSGIDLSAATADVLTNSPWDSIGPPAPPKSPSARKSRYRHSPETPPSGHVKSRPRVPHAQAVGWQRISFIFSRGAKRFFMPVAEFCARMPPIPVPEISPSQFNPESDDLNPGELFAKALGGLRRPHGGTETWEPLAVGDLQRLLPSYQIIELVGRGGMGAVYKGRQPSLDRVVAIKILGPYTAFDNLQFRERFDREARLMAQLRHPGIVVVHDAGETACGLLYFVMEFVSGTDVGKLIAAGGRLAPNEAIRIATRVCEALTCAHDRGVVHRDIKPSNVMIEDDGTVKVADFGLAKVAATADGLTRSDIALGSPDFIAPEAMIPGAEVDVRADVYAVGVMLYQMLTGRLPRGRFEPPSGILPRLDPRIDQIVDRALQTDRDKRYGSAASMKVDLERLLSGKAKNNRLQPQQTMLVRRGSLVLLVLAGLATLVHLTPWKTSAQTELPTPALANPFAAGDATPIWIPVAFTDAAPEELHRKAEFLGSQLHLWSYGTWRPLQGRRLHQAAQRLSFVWRETTGDLSLNYKDGSPDGPYLHHYFLTGAARDGGQYWSCGYSEGGSKVLATGFVKPTLQPGDAVTLQYAVIGDHHYCWVNDRLVGHLTHPVSPIGGELFIQCSEAVLDHYEYLPLDGMSEAEALKLLKIKPP